MSYGRVRVGRILLAAMDLAAGRPMMHSIFIVLTWTVNQDKYVKEGRRIIAVPDVFGSNGHNLGF